MFKGVRGWACFADTLEMAPPAYGDKVYAFTAVHRCAIAASRFASAHG